MNLYLKLILCLAVSAFLASSCASDPKKDAKDPVAAHITELEEAAASHPSDPRAQYAVGNAYFDAHRYAEAQTAYQRAISLDEKFADAHTNLGLVYRLQGNLDGAIQEYQRALAIAPDDTVTRRNLIVALSSAKRLPEAADQLEVLAQQTPKDAATLQQLADLQMNLEAFDKARAAYEQLVTLAPEDPDAWYRLGTCRKISGDVTGAIDAWTKATELNRDLAPAHAALAAAYTDQGDYDRAWKSVRETQRLGGYLDPTLVTRLQDLSGKLGPE
jgi:tetratricopeptide (TPR) repeat protein